MKPESKPLVYIPRDARINEKTEESPPPTTKYQERQFEFTREKVQEITGVKDAE